MTAKNEPATAPAKSSAWLDRLERLGNLLPDPVVIFLILSGAVIIVSALVAATGWSAVHPVTGKVLHVQSLLSVENVRKLLVEMPDTLTGFPPLGLVLVVILGASVAERSGLFHALLGGAVRRIPRAAMTPALFLLGLLSHHAADAAYIVIIPLSALVYKEARRHPLVGIAAAYAGISGAFAANLIPGQFDVLMLGITQAAARLVDPVYPLNPLGNWGFTLALGLILTPVAWFITDRVIEPRLGPSPTYEANEADGAVASDLNADQKAGLNWAGIAALVIIALFAVLTLTPGYTPLIDDEAKGPARLEPFYRALIAGFMLLFLVCGAVYGHFARTVRGSKGLIAAAAEGVKTLAPYIVIVFFAAHFVAMFSWSNLGPVMAVHGAEALKAIHLPTPLLLLVLLLISSVLDILIGSASAKWTIMAPVVVPMLMLLGVAPEMTTAAYRMGDSIFNIITPVAANFPLVLILCRRWAPEFGVGSLIALMVPYSMAFAAFGLTLVVLWSAMGLPVGPGAPATYIPPAHASAR